MELELTRMELGCYQPVLDTTAYREETLEMIVPATCPDILRIVDTEGRACLRQREAMDGSVQLAGSVKLTALYLPDGMEGIWKLEGEVPFQCVVENANVTSRCAVVASARVVAAETRAINPRKVLFRVSVALCVQAYAPGTADFCVGVEDEERWGVQQWLESCQSSLITCVQEKAFSFSDELTIPGSKPAVSELLRSRCAVYCNESKVIGSKLIFKGGITVELLCRGEDATLFQTDFDLPFSQIMEVTPPEEEADCRLEITLTDWQFQLMGEEGRLINAQLELCAQAVLRETRSAQLLTDAYSIHHPVTCEDQLISLSELVERGNHRQTVREVLETGDTAKSVYEARLNVGQVAVEREGDCWVARAEAQFHVLYCAVEEEYASVSRQIPVSCQIDLPENCQISCGCVGEDVQASATAGGIEARFTLNFQVSALSHGRVRNLCAIHLDEEAQDPSAKQPSIVLRRMGKEERLWEIAKCYYTTSEEIIQANDLSGEQAAVGQFLLIPRKR